MIHLATKKQIFFTITFFLTFTLYSQVWQPVGTVGPSYRVGSLIEFNSDLYAGGYFNNSDGTRDVIKWDGSIWSSVDRVITNNVYSFEVYNGELFAGGFICSNPPDTSNLCTISSWNGVTWNSVDFGIGDTGQFSNPASVEALKEYNSELYAGGMFFKASGISAKNIAKWNGSSWSSVGQGTSGRVYSLTVYNNELIVGGAFTDAGGNTTNNIAKWNGSTWSSLSTGMNGVVYALTVYNGDLYAAGGFTEAGGVPVNRIAKWDGTVWSSVGDGMDNNIYTLAVFNNELYAGGKFILAGGIPANRVAKWNGTNWFSLGEGMNDEVWSLAVYNSDLYAGGLFTTADNTVASYVARLNLTAGLIELDNSMKHIVKVTDLLGRETEDKPNTLLIYIYNDGTKEKVFRVE